MSDTRKVNVCGVPFEMGIADGGVLFSNKSGFWGVSARYMWAYRSGLWYLTEVHATWNSVPGVHLIRMHTLLTEMIGREHEQFDLTFKQAG
jgi:hypothetical protein